MRSRFLQAHCRGCSRQLEDHRGCAPATSTATISRPGPQSPRSRVRTTAAAGPARAAASSEMSSVRASICPSIMTSPGQAPASHAAVCSPPAAARPPAGPPNSAAARAASQPAPRRRLRRRIAAATLSAAASRRLLRARPEIGLVGVVLVLRQLRPARRARTAAGRTSARARATVSCRPSAQA